MTVTVTCWAPAAAEPVEVQVVDWPAVSVVCWQVMAPSALAPPTLVMVLWLLLLMVTLRVSWVPGAMVGRGWLVADWPLIVIAPKLSWLVPGVGVWPVKYAFEVELREFGPEPIMMICS